ncbi:extracellular solute-binding protein [Mesorhizobium sp. BR1-1-16]|uniref:ABC transporter substrate-binding protein n=1 Tax=Mesorhizobium sp. BR1-1-16 TaxID=2876653 RepID=UPI001CCAC1DE|nr:extracellular solute-binding protein [Mesorhizobium sp. BR1-1-16]
MKLTDLNGAAARRIAVAAALLITTALPALADSLGPVEGEITFSWFGGQSRADKTHRIIELFKADNPGVSVVEQNSDWDPYWQKLTLQASANNIPCTVMMQNRWLATFADPNILLPLDDYVASGAIDVKGIPESAMNSSRGADGHLYQIPSSVFFNGVIFNRTWLEKAGLKVPPSNWTWDDMTNLLEQMKGKVPEGAVAAHNMAMENDMFVSWVQSHGDKVFDNGKVAFSKATLAQWFEYWEKLRKDGVTDTPDVMVEENGSLIETSDIANGRTFMTARPPNRLDSHQKVIDAVRPGEQLAVLPAPAGPAGGGWDVGSNGIAIGAHCPANLIPASIAWLNFFTQDSRAAKIYESDLGPVTVDRLQEEQISSPDTSRGQKDQILMFRQIAPQAKPILWPANSSGLLAQALSRNYQAVAFGQVSVDEAVDQVFADLSSIGN